MADLVTLAELRAQLGMPDEDIQDDFQLTRILTAATRAITEMTGHRFYATTETRYFSPRNSLFCDVDDLLSITTLKSDTTGDGTYDTTWDTGDYVLLPRNASADARPYTTIRVHPTGDHYFYRYTYHESVQIAGSFGYASTTPPVIKEIALLAGEQFFRRRDSPLGVSGSSGFVQTIKAQWESDPQILGVFKMYRSVL